MTDAVAAPAEVVGERSLLKRKQAGASPSEVSKLKEKERRKPPERKKDDVGVLREKLATAPSSQPRAPVPRPAPLRPAPANRCRIVWWRGYVKSEFQAQLPSADGRAAVVATSPAFRWSRGEAPPADLPEAAEAHAALRKELEADGWVAAREGAEWYAIEFDRKGGG
jgi:hypothetical protein